MRKAITKNNTHALIEFKQVQCGWITQVDWSPDGSTLAVAGANGVRLYAGEFGGNPTHVLEGHEGHVKSVAFSPIRSENKDPRLYMASSASDTTIKLWDASDLGGKIKAKTTLSDQGNSVDYVVFSPTFGTDPRARLTLVACCADGTINLYDVETKTLKSTLRGHEAEVTSATFALNGHVLITGSRDNTLRLWDVQSETSGTILGEHDDWVRHVKISPSGTVIASASKDTTVRLWDAHSGENLAIIQAHDNGADCVAFSPDGTLLATGGRDNLIRIWDFSQAINSDTLTPDDALMTLEGHWKPIMSLAFNPTGSLLASGSGDNTVRLWGIGSDDFNTDELSLGKTSKLSDPTESED